MSDTARGKLGIVVGGGPAPGINGVISSVTIEAINQGLEVIGIRDVFKNFVNGDISQIRLQIGRTLIRLGPGKHAPCSRDSIRFTAARGS